MHFIGYKWITKVDLDSRRGEQKSHLSMAEMSKNFGNAFENHFIYINLKCDQYSRGKVKGGMN